MPKKSHEELAAAVTAEASEAATITISGFEKWGPIVVRPKTVRDDNLRIPGLMERLLVGEDEPGARVLNNAWFISQATFAIVEPDDLVERVLDSPDPADAGFFYAFNKEYQAWLTARLENAQGKEPGEGVTKAGGKSSVSSSETDETSSQQTIAG